MGIALEGYHIELNFMPTKAKHIEFQGVMIDGVVLFCSNRLSA
jgi:hypothetical protein